MQELSARPYRFLGNWKDCICELGKLASTFIHVMSFLNVLPTQCRYSASLVLRLRREVLLYGNINFSPIELFFFKSKSYLAKTNQEFLCNIV